MNRRGFIIGIACLPAEKLVPEFLLPFDSATGCPADARRFTIEEIAKIFAVPVELIAPAKTSPPSSRRHRA